MELEQLKSVWQAEAALQNQDQDPGGREIQAALLQKGRSSLARIRRNIMVELGLLWLLLALTAVWLQPYWPFLLLWERWALPGMAVLGLAFYGLKLVALGQLQAHLPLKTQLQRRTYWLGHYLQFYRFAVVALVPLLGAGGVGYGYFRASAYHAQPLTMDFAWIGLIALAYAGLAAWFSRAYVRRLYGRYFQQLQDTLAELDSFSDPK